MVDIQYYVNSCCSANKSRLTLLQLWTIAHKAPLSMGLPRQEYWNRLPFPSLGDLPNPGVKLMSPALAGLFFTTEPPGKPHHVNYCVQCRDLQLLKVILHL